MLRKNYGDWVKTCILYELVEGVRGRGRSRTTWNQVVERDMREHGLRREDARDRGPLSNPLHKRGKTAVKHNMCVLLQYGYKSVLEVLFFKI